jgi:phenylacetate-CoA ligase
MVARGNGERAKLVRTSGSTNEALPFYTNALREGHINAARMRGHRWIGIEKGRRELYFWASPLELDVQDRLRRMRDRLINDRLTCALELTPDRAPGIVNDWRRWHVECLFGYPSSLLLLSRMARQAGVDLLALRQAGLRVVCTTAEILGDMNRQLLSEAFGVPVYDSYGLREGGLIGHECQQMRMHTTDEQLILETIDPRTLEPTDQRGELVVTNLVGRVMPIIRYRTGDMVTLDATPCACGRSLSTIRVTGGRITDSVLTSAGKWVSGYAFIYICRSVPGVVNFQVRQDRRGEVRVLLVTDGQFPSDGRQRIRNRVRRRMNSDDAVSVELVDDIRPAPSGKYRPVVSGVAGHLFGGRAADITTHPDGPRTDAEPNSEE